MKTFTQHAYGYLDMYLWNWITLQFGKLQANVLNILLMKLFLLTPLVDRLYNNLAPAL